MVATPLRIDLFILDEAVLDLLQRQMVLIIAALEPGGCILLLATLDTNPVVLSLFALLLVLGELLTLKLPDGLEPLILLLQLPLKFIYSVLGTSLEVLLNFVKSFLGCSPLVSVSPPEVGTGVHGWLQVWQAARC